MEQYTMLDYTGYEEYLLDSNVYFIGFCRAFIFADGDGATVIKHDHSYGGTEDLFVIAYLYDRKIQRADIYGWLTTREVLNRLEELKNRE
jgi:hypothetical protein